MNLYLVFRRLPRKLMICLVRLLITRRLGTIVSMAADIMQLIGLLLFFGVVSVLGHFY